MIVAISGSGRILAAATLMTECAEKVQALGLSDHAGSGWIRYRVASPALQAAIDEGNKLDSIEILVGPESVCLKPVEESQSYMDGVDRFPQREREDIARIREHVLSVALGNTK